MVRIVWGAILIVCGIATVGAAPTEFRDFPALAVFLGIGFCVGGSFLIYYGDKDRLAALRGEK